MFKPKPRQNESQRQSDLTRCEMGTMSEVTAARAPITCNKQTAEFVIVSVAGGVGWAVRYAMSHTHVGSGAGVSLLVLQAWLTDC